MRQLALLCGLVTCGGTWADTTHSHGHTLGHAQHHDDINQVDSGNVPMNPWPVFNWMWIKVEPKDFWFMIIPLRLQNLHHLLETRPNVYSIIAPNNGYKRFICRHRTHLYLLLIGWQIHISVVYDLVWQKEIQRKKSPNERQNFSPWLLE